MRAPPHLRTERASGRDGGARRSASRRKQPLSDSPRPTRCRQSHPHGESIACKTPSGTGSRATGRPAATTRTLAMNARRRTNSPAGGQMRSLNTWFPRPPSTTAASIGAAAPSGISTWASSRRRLRTHLLRGCRSPPSSPDPHADSVAACGIGSRRTRRTRAALVGRYQFQSPSSFISEGTSRMRITVASKMIPAARPMANTLIS